MATGVTVSHMQTGWLSILEKGFLHRDISIGNTLMLDPPATMKPFEAQTSLLDVDESSGYAKLLEDAVRKMDFSEGCHGFVTDGDMAAKLEGYFTPRVTGETSVGMFSDAGNLTNNLHAGNLRVHVQKVTPHSVGFKTPLALTYR